MTEQQTEQPAQAKPAAEVREPKPPRPPKVRPWIAAGGLHRAGANLVTVAVGAIAGYISWLHLYALGLDQPSTPGLTAEQEKLAAGLTPFAIDGLILAGTLKLREARVNNRPAHWAAYLAVIIGVALTMAGNVASAPDSFWAQVLAAAPPAAFLLSVEVLAGKPMTHNLWDVIKGWHGRRRAAKAAKDGGKTVPPAEITAQVAKGQQALVAELPVAKGRRANSKPGSPERETGPVPTVADPQPDNTPDTATPVADPQPQQPTPPAEEPAAEPTQRTAPSAPRVRVQAAQRAAATPAVPGATDWARDEQGRVIGTNARPARTVVVDGTPRVLSGPELRADARARVERALEAGADRQGLGAWISRQYDPPFKSRWGQVLVAEVAEPAPAEPVEGTPGIRSPEGAPIADEECPVEREPVSV